MRGFFFAEDNINLSKITLGLVNGRLDRKPIFFEPTELLRTIQKFVGFY